MVRPAGKARKRDIDPLLPHLTWSSPRKVNFVSGDGLYFGGILPLLPNIGFQLRDENFEYARTRSGVSKVPYDPSGYI